MNYIKKRFFRTKHQTTSLEGVMRPQNSDNLQRNRVFARFVGGAIIQDFYVWAKMESLKPSLWGFIKLYLTRPEFRCLLDFRLKRKKMFLPLRVLNFPFSRGHQLYISARKGIGGGLYFQHGFSTIVFCNSMGSNCFINQQVTIGYDGSTGIPTIGNDVRISAGAKVLGKITIGDDVYIGANAVVVKDIPAHSMVVGVPGKVIKTRNSVTDEWKRVDTARN